MPPNRSIHNGIDYASQTGTKIALKKPGKVLRIENKCIPGTFDCGGGYGNFVEIEHSSTIKTLYAHLSKVNVQPGQYIYKGKIIGETGNTGRSTGPHLHWEYKINNVKSNGTNFANDYFGLV